VEKIGVTARDIPSIKDHLPVENRVINPNEIDRLLIRMLSPIVLKAVKRCRRQTQDISVSL